MRALMPAPGARWLRSEVDRLFDRWWDGDEFPNIGEWAPKMDLVESAEALTLKVEVPGIEPKDMQVTLENDILTLKGEKRDETEKKSENVLRMERSYGAFARSLRLPSPVDATKVNATFKNGVLIVAMPKAASAKGTMIPIKIT